MNREVSYEKQTLDSPNPLTRFAHRSRYRISLDLVDRHLPVGGLMVDFGAGEGAFLDQLGGRRPDAKLLAVEPHMEIRFPQVRKVASLSDVEPGTVDVVGTFEVLEHVSDADLDRFLNEAAQALKPEGVLLVTVPIMYGPVLPVKELARMTLHRRLGDIGPIELLKATLGLPINRPAKRLATHKGFDFRWLDREISRVFTIRERSYSPFPKLPWSINSQALFVATKRANWAHLQVTSI